MVSAKKMSNLMFLPLDLEGSLKWIPQNLPLLDGNDGSKPCIIQISGDDIACSKDGEDGFFEWCEAKKMQN